jgi:hypothetical protein
MLQSLFYKSLLIEFSFSCEEFRPSFILSSKRLAFNIRGAGPKKLKLGESVPNDLWRYILMKSDKS